MNESPIAFIGAGNMARSLVNGLINSGRQPASIRASDPQASQREALGAMGVIVSSENTSAISGAAVVVLAVKPQVMGEVVTSLALRPEQLVISIAAGVPLSAIAAWAPAGTAIVRCMPNTPALLGAGITGMYPNEHVTQAQRSATEVILGSAGRTLWVKTEDQLDAVTAVSGSGPAYFFYLMESMIDAGVSLGLTRTDATTLCLETAYGAARMAREGGEPPDRLRANVTSPGGTTERALSILDAAGTRAAISAAVTGAAKRAQELAKEFGQS